MGEQWNRWFRKHGTDLQWLMESPAGKASRCDRSFRHLVAADEPRLRVASKQGPIRRRGKGQRHEYLCVQCAALVWDTKPPSIVHEKQEKLF